MPLLTIVELPEYLDRAAQLLDDEERTAILVHLAQHPDAGIIMQGTGGIRKLRWALGHRGKSKGVRLVYYYCNASMPLFLLTLFSKGEKANLSKAERNTLSRLTTALVDHYGTQGV